MPKRKITDPFLKNHTLPGKEIEYTDEVVPGLVVRIVPSGSISFSYRYFLSGKGKRYTIGRYPDVSLAGARKKAKELFADILGGSDPQRKKVRRREDITVEGLAEEFKKKHLPKLKASTRTDYQERIKNVIVPALGEIKAGSLSPDDIIDLLDMLADERGSPIQSNRVRAILSSIYSFGQKYRIVRINPVKAVHRFGKETQRERFYSDEELKRIWTIAAGYGFPTGNLLQMLILTGQRLGETRHMRWSYLQDGAWRIPKELTKANRTHTLPMPDMAISLLEGIRKMNIGKVYVFQSPVKEDQPVSWVQWISKAIRDHDEGVKDFRIHDIRRTVATNLSELGTSRTVLGKVLNHKALAGDNHVTARYDRYDYMKEKRRAMELWNERLGEILL